MNMDIPTIIQYCQCWFHVFTNSKKKDSFYQIFVSLFLVHELVIKHKGRVTLSQKRVQNFKVIYLNALQKKIYNQSLLLTMYSLTTSIPINRFDWFSVVDKSLHFLLEYSFRVYISCDALIKAVRMNASYNEQCSNVDYFTTHSFA